MSVGYEVITKRKDYAEVRRQGFPVARIFSTEKGHFYKSFVGGAEGRADTAKEALEQIIIKNEGANHEKCHIQNAADLE